MSEQAPSSTKPYLVRAIHEWCSDNGLTPYLAVSVTDQVRVPKEHVRNSEIVLNIGLLATDRLALGNDDISFQARFSGRMHQIFVPMDSVMAIYAKETGNGMAFEVAIDVDSPEDTDSPAALGGEVVSITTRADDGDRRGGSAAAVSGPAGLSGSSGSSRPPVASGSSAPSAPLGPVRRSRKLDPSELSGSLGPSGTAGSSGPAGPSGTSGPSGPARPSGTSDPSGPEGPSGPRPTGRPKLTRVK